MFNITEQEVVGTTNKLLFNIWKSLEAMNEPATAEQTQPDLEGLKRNELMALVKALPVKPEGWTRLGNEQLKELLKKEGV